MRKYATLMNPIDEIKKIMIYECNDGVYLFYYNSEEDVPGIYDDWFQNLTGAEEFCKTEYKIKDSDWNFVDDPMPNCQHDIVAPVRIKGRINGDPEWGVFEKLIGGEWVEIKFS